MSFAERLIEAFDGASMAEIARRLDVPHSTIRNYVQQNRLPAADVLIEIANRTNVSLNWLLTGDSNRFGVSEKETLIDLPPQHPVVQALSDMVREIVRDELRDVGGEVAGIEPAEMILAPVVAHIGPGLKVIDPKEEIRKMIGESDIAEIEQRLKRRKRKTG